MSDHAFLSCSGSNSWVNCPYHATVATLFPEDENSEEAMIGTAAHWVLEQTLSAHRDCLPVKDYLNIEAPNGIIINQEIIDGVNESVQEVIELIGNRHHLWGTTFLEYRVHVKYVHLTKCWGTADIIIWDKDEKRIYVLDFKFGHVYVESWQNWQLMLYAAGCLDVFYNTDWNDITLHLQTLQPRCYTSRNKIPWVVKANDIMKHLDIARNAANDALSPCPAACTGGHCLYCTGRHACTAYLRATENALDTAEQGKIKIPTAEAVGVELMMLDRAIDILEARRIALSVEAERHIHNGNQVPGYHMKLNTSSLKWVKEKQEVLALGNTLGIDLTKPTELITPTQAISKGVDKSVIGRYAEKKTTGFSLKPFHQLEAIKIFRKGT